MKEETLSEEQHIAVIKRADLLIKENSDLSEGVEIALFLSAALRLQHKRYADSRPDFLKNSVLDKISKDFAWMLVEENFKEVIKTLTTLMMVMDEKGNV